VSRLERAEFRTVFEAERDPLYRFLYRLTRNASDAEDLLQETFLAVWRKRDQFEGRGSLGGYLRRTAWHLYLNSRERSERRKGLAPVRSQEVELATPSDATAERNEAMGFLVARVQEALASLPDNARECFVLFRYEGLTCPQIADLTGTPLKTVESRVARATHALSEKLRPYRQHLPI
jgi:RNA polymerase sigma-70 factor (ECF subfamily)